MAAGQTRKQFCVAELCEAVKWLSRNAQALDKHCAKSKSSNQASLDLSAFVVMTIPRSLHNTSMPIQTSRQCNVVFRAHRSQITTMQTQKSCRLATGSAGEIRTSPQGYVF